MDRLDSIWDISIIYIYTCAYYTIIYTIIYMYIYTYYYTYTYFHCRCRDRSIFVQQCLFLHTGTVPSTSDQFSFFFFYWNYFFNDETRSRWDLECLSWDTLSFRRDWWMNIQPCKLFGCESRCILNTMVLNEWHWWPWYFATNLIPMNFSSFDRYLEQ